MAASETLSRYFKAFTDLEADEVVASSNKLLRSDPSVRPAPALCFIWERCGGQKFPLFIFTLNSKVHVETKRFGAVVKSSFYRRSLEGTGMNAVFCTPQGFSRGQQCFEIPQVVIAK